MVVQDLEERFMVKPFQLTVETVMKKPRKEPYGARGALGLKYPLWFWVALGSLVLGTLFFSLFRLHRRSKRLKVIEELKRHNTALGPYNQLNKDLRKLSRQYIFSVKQKWDREKIERYVRNLDDIFRLYLLREFIVPALDWKTSLVMKEIRRNDRHCFLAYEEPLRKYLKELDRALQDIDKVDMEDCQQLTQIARKVSQTIWQAHKGRA